MIIIELGCPHWCLLIISCSFMKQSEKQEGIPPQMFKTTMAASYSKFSSMKEQDAYEFFLHFLIQINNLHTDGGRRGRPMFDPSSGFTFDIDLRPISGVPFFRRCFSLSLIIPTDGPSTSISLRNCLSSSNFNLSEKRMHEQSDWYTKEKKTIMEARLNSFPKYLVMHMQRFVKEPGVENKLDVRIDVDDIINIGHLHRERGQNGGRYELIGFISHLGTSIDHGRYIAHILKRGSWVVFDDDKVGEYCEGGIPDKGNGYLYFFERMEKRTL
ncbi:ubiquitin carboxyl-terminal hydrolase 14-like [Pyrus communis]|uniref:ubiquitin carboxyl-terminal hydrolase 14-like n=1 Tax=Pyrus communis TaxID=23211 RepID=UPI0035C13296